MTTPSDPIPTKPQNANRLPIAWHGLDVLAIGVIFILLVVGSSGLLLALIPDNINARNNLTASTSLLLVGLQLASMGFPILFISQVRNISWSDISPNRLTGRQILVDTLIGIAIIPLMLSISYLVIALQGESFDNPQLDLLLPEEITVLSKIGFVILIGIATPFVEEWLFRGVLYRWLRQYLPFIGSATLSGLIFGLFHLEPPLIVATTALGVVCAWVYERTGSIWSAIIVHMMNNLLQVVALYLTL